VSEDHSWMEDLSWNDLRKYLINAYTRNNELEATLERVKQLPQKWRNINKWNIYIESGMKVCADELESAVKGESP